MRRLGRIIVACGVLGFGYIAYLFLTLPDVRDLRTHNPPKTAFMRLREDEARAQGREPKHVQRWLPYGRMSPNLTRAVLVAEDAGFWGHEGIDLAEIRKSLETDWEKGTLLRGASTITQQLAKNLYLSPSRNPFRKLTELMIARRLEHELTKTRIFELYLNDIEWGDGIYGADAAARAYFGVSASALDPDQAALMAGAIVNPRELVVSRPNGRLRARQRIIRGRMGNVTPPPASSSTGAGDPISDPIELPDGSTTSSATRPARAEPSGSATPPAARRPGTVDGRPTTPEPQPSEPEGPEKRSPEPDPSPPELTSPPPTSDPPPPSRIAPPSTSDPAPPSRNGQPPIPRPFPGAR